MAQLHNSRSAQAFTAATLDVLLSVLNIVSCLGVIPLYLLFISTADYGIWLVLGSIFGLAGVADFGVLVWLTREISDAATFSDARKVTSLYATALLFQSVLAFLFLGVGLVAYLFLDRWLSTTDPINSTVTTTYLITLAGFCLKLPMSIPSGVLLGRQRVALVNVVNGTSLILCNLIPIIPLFLGYGILSFALTQISVNFLFDAMLFIIMKRAFPQVRLSRSPDLHIFGKRLMNFAVSFQSIKLAFAFKQYVCNPVIHWALGPSSVTAYNLTNKIPSSIPGMISRGVVATYPSLCEMHAQDEATRYREAFLKISRLALRVSLLSLGGVLTLNPDFLTLWVGRELYAGSATLCLLVLIMCKDIFFNSLGVFIYAAHDFGRWPHLALLEVVSLVVLALWFSTMFGLAGVALAFLLSTSVANVYILWRLLSRLQVAWPTYRQHLLGVLLKGVPTLVTGVLIAEFGSAQTWIGLISFGVLILAINIISYDLPLLVASPHKGAKERLLFALRAL